MASASRIKEGMKYSLLEAATKCEPHTSCNAKRLPSGANGWMRPG
jgi:hypothetical protein